jgi:DNA-binding PadR family transcriptional regulator
MVISDVDNFLEQEQIMQEIQRNPEALLPLTPAVFHILLALVGSDRHGYGIMQEVQGYTDGKLRLGPGTLYRSIKQMLAEGLIIELDERPDPELDDQRRRYYRLAEFGQRVLKAETERLEHILKVARARQLLPDAEATTGGGGH